MSDLLRRALAELQESQSARFAGDNDMAIMHLTFAVAMLLDRVAAYHEPDDHAITDTVRRAIALEMRR